MVYDLAMSSGLALVRRDPNLMGIGRKMPSVIFYGVNMVQVDMETQTSAEIFEPDVEQFVKRFYEDLGIRWVMHGEIGQTVAFETALLQRWRGVHRRLHQYLDAMYEKFVKPKDMSKYLPGYIDFHISNEMVLGYFAERFRVAGLPTVDFTGRYDWTELLKENPELDEWFRDVMLFLVYGREVPLISTGVQDIKDRSRDKVASENLEKLRRENPQEYDAAAREYAGKHDNIPPRTLDEWMEALPKIVPKPEAIIDEVYSQWLGATATRHTRGAITDEEIAYAIIAKYLETKKDDQKEPLWKLFFGDKTLEDLEKQWGSKEKPRRLANPATGDIYLDPNLIAMVGCRYIIGHFEADPLPEYLAEMFQKKPERENDSFYKKKGIDKLKQVKVTLVFENPELSEVGTEGLQRIIRGKHMYNFVKSVEQMLKTDLIRLLIDLNHWVHNAIDPASEFDILKKEAPDFGKYVKAIHIYEPWPIHEHAPFDIPSDEQVKIYRWLYQIRQIGFKEGILVFERGGGENPQQIARTVILALREIITNLEKNVEPKELPLEFYGISPGGVFSPERQMVIIREHARDPLKGLIIAPEEEHTALGKEALTKPGMTPEKWKKEELR